MCKKFLDGGVERLHNSQPISGSIFKTVYQAQALNLAHRTVGWGDEGTPTKCLSFENVGVRPSPHIWTPRLLQDKFLQLMPATEIMIAAIYPVS